MQTETLSQQFSFFWASSSFIHCLAALDFGAGVEQPFGCLIVQNRQVVQSIGRSMDWTLKDNMVDGLVFWATLTGSRGGHTPFVQVGVETSDTGAEAVEPDPGSSWEGHSGRVCVPVSGMKMRVLWSCPPTLRSIDDPPTAPHVCCCCQITWWIAVRWAEMGVSTWDAVHLHLMSRWAALSGADVQAPWHGVLEIVWFHCDETQVGCLRGLEGCRWCRTQASSHNLQGVVDGGFNEAGMSTAAPNRNAVLCGRMVQG